MVDFLREFLVSSPNSKNTVTMIKRLLGFGLGSHSYSETGTSEADAQVRIATLLLLDAIGEDVERPGIVDTPKRVAKMWLHELASGIGVNPGERLMRTFEEGHDEMVVVKDIPFYSYCEHHLVPFFGVAHIGYVPDGGRVIGLSKLPRMLMDIARRPQVQENITTAVADTIMEHLKPMGCGVIINAEHLCMSMRGVEKPGTKTTTSALRGVFRDKPEVRQEFLSLIKIDR